MVDGTNSPAAQPLRDLLERNLASGADSGASIALIHDGEVIADLWGGEAAPGRPWTSDTIVQVWSVTKVMAGLAFLVLADRGEIDLDAPVAQYWPEFGAHGKDGTLVRHVLGHTSGVPGWSVPTSVEELLDLPVSEATLAAEEPWYDAGSAPAYQLVAHGHLLDGIVRGATGKTLADVLHDEVVGPMGGGFHLGVPEQRLADVADLIAPPPDMFDPALMTPFIMKMIANPLLGADVVNSAPWRQGAVGGAGGHGTALGIARAQAVVSHGGEFDGVRLLSQDTIDRIFEVQADGTDLVIGLPLTYGIGYGLPNPSAPAIPSGRTCWWTGFGGAIVVNDLDSRTTFAYAEAKMAAHLVSSERTDEYVRTAFECVGASR